MMRHRRSIGSVLTAIMLITTAWCICLPQAAAATAAKPTAHSCCHDEKDHPDPQRRPAQDCPSCGWSVLREARTTAPQVKVPFHAFAPIAFLLSDIALPPALNFVGDVDRFASHPPPPTLLNLHCMLTT